MPRLNRPGAAGSTRLSQDEVDWIVVHVRAHYVWPGVAEAAFGPGPGAT